MSLTSPRYWLKADSGRTSPVNAVTESGALTGGTIALTEISTGVWAYRCSGALSTAAFAALPSAAFSFREEDGSRTMALRLRIQSNPSGGSRVAGFVEATSTISDGMAFCWNGTNTFAAISSGIDIADATSRGLSVGGALKTYVIRITPSDVNGGDFVQMWAERTDRAGASAPDFAGEGGANFTSVGALQRFLVDPLGGTLDIADAVMWQAGDLTDAECAAAADNLRAAMTVVVDTTAPTITGSITVGTVTTTSIQMSWPAGADNTAVTSYEVSSNGGGAWSDVGLVLTHTFTGLTAATSYGLRVRPKDAAGNVAVTPLSATQSTASSADVTVPTQSGSITVGTVTSTSIQFSWPAGADNVAVTAYEVSSNGGGAYTVLGNVLTHTFTGLTPSTSYGLRVRAKDAAGNVSTPALSATQSTTSAGSPTATTFTFTMTGAVSLTGLKYAIFEGVTPDVWVAPILKGANETTDASGVCTVSVTGLTTKLVGQLGSAFVTNSDGSASGGAQSATRRAAYYVGVFS